MTNNYYSYWNTGVNCVCLGHFDVDLSAQPSMAYLAFEQADHVKPGEYISSDKIDQMILDGAIDNLAVQIVCHIAAGKFLTLPQIAAFLELRGLPHAEHEIKSRLWMLVRGNFLRQIECRVNTVATVSCYSLGSNGSNVAHYAGVYLHRGNGFLNSKKRLALGYNLVDDPWEIKRTLQVNNMILNALRAGVPLLHYGVQETMRTEDGGLTDAIVRTSGTMQIDKANHLMVEVVRRQADWEKIANKVDRFNRMVSRRDFLESVNVDITSLPQLVICGEDDEHNNQIHQLLVNSGIITWNSDLTILYTNDRLSSTNSTALYAFGLNGSKEWYTLPVQTDAVPVAS